MNRRALRALGRLVLLVLPLAIVACATGLDGSDSDDAALRHDAPVAPGVDLLTFDLVSPLDDVSKVDAGELDGGVPDHGAPDVGPMDSGALDIGITDVSGCPSGTTLCGIACVELQTSTTNCGRCGVVCSAGSVCTAGACTVAACATTASDCDGDAANGCEVVHGTATNTCAAGEDLGAYCGDTSCGTLCPSTSLRVVQTRTGNRSRWFRARLNECSLCGASLGARVRLTVPAGVDYDLFVYRPCGTLVGSSEAAAGLPDEVTVSQSESPLSSDSFDFVIEVRWFNSGASCAPWTLTFEARGAGPSSC